MPVIIQELKDHEMLVNDKQVVKDSNDNWIAKVELSLKEIRAFQEHITAKRRGCSQ